MSSRGDNLSEGNPLLFPTARNQTSTVSQSRFLAIFTFTGKAVLVTAAFVALATVWSLGKRSPVTAGLTDVGTETFPSNSGTGLSAKSIGEGMSGWSDMPKEVPEVHMTRPRLYGKNVGDVESSKPNMIFLLLDDMGYNDFGYQSSDLSEMTPNLDAMAAKGVKLENYYTDAICTPSRASLMTGRHTYRYGMQESIIGTTSPWGLPLSEVTIAERFRDAGYDTHMIGKWHLGLFKEDYHPANRGFNTFLGFLGGAEDYTSHDNCIADVCYKDFGYADQDGIMDTESKTPRWAPQFIGKYSTTIFADRVIDLGREWKAKKEEAKLTGKTEDDKPAFLYYAAQGVHNPLTLPPPNSFTEEEQALLDGLKVDPLRRRFAEVLLFQDKEIGRVMRELGDTGFLDDAVVVVASDNGACPTSGGSSFPLRGRKHSYFQGGIRVPAFVYSETRLPLQAQGMTRSGMMHSIDWTATLGSLAGYSLRKGEVDSINQWDMISGAATHSLDLPRTELMIGYEKWAWNTTGDYNAEVDPMGALIIGDWKIIVREWCTGWYSNSVTDVVSTGECDVKGECTKCSDTCHTSPGFVASNYLFNIKNDPYEKVNLYHDHTQLAHDMMTRWEELGSEAINPHYSADVEDHAYNVWTKFNNYVVAWEK